MNKRKLGSDKENLAVEYLESNGYSVIKRNFFTRSGEIDIIAENEGYLCFIEVKYRKSLNEGHPSEAVNYSKIRKISMAAKVYMNYAGYDEFFPCRFDVVSITGDKIELIKNAFEYVLN